MNEILFDSGSFRDPKGRIFYYKGKVYRALTHTGTENFNFVKKTGLLERLEKDRKVISSISLNDPQVNKLFCENIAIIEHNKIPFISYPYEWSFYFLKAAALLHLDIHLQALESGVTLSDASAYNIQFYGCKPIFIDILSFKKLQNGEPWVAHRQFCEQFLNPLLLKSKLGLNPNAWYRGTQEGISVQDMNRLLPWTKKLDFNTFIHVVAQSMLQKTEIIPTKDYVNKNDFPIDRFYMMLSSLKKWITKLEPSGAKKTEWSNYTTTNNYSDEELSKKSDFIAEFCSNIKPKMLWDLGCNTGHFSKVALKNGAFYSVGFDYDLKALQKAYISFANSNILFQPLFFDCTNPSPNQGWNESERKSMSERKNADAILALAFIHHIVIAKNIPLKDAIDWLVNLAPNGVIEFIPKEDEMIKTLLQLRDDIFIDYTEDNFINLLCVKNKIIKSTTITKSGRKLFWYQQK